MTDQKFKADAGKAKPDLLHIGMARALRIVQATMEYGAEKYEEHSWRNVEQGEERYLRAAERHRQERLLLNKGEFVSTVESCDDESGLPHIAHEIFNLLAIMELAIANSPDEAVLMRALVKFNQPPTAHKQP